MHYTIYKTTNLANGKIYIGKHQTTDLNDGYLGSGKLLKRAIEKYGIESFKKEILFVFDNESDMNTKEAELVTSDFILREDTYNMCVGGQGGFSYINSIRTEDQIRESITAATKRQKEIYELNPELKIEHSLKATKELLSKYPNGTFYGRSHSEETRKKISEKAKLQVHSEERRHKHSLVMREKQSGVKNSQFGSMWITNGDSNRKIKKELDTVPEGWYKGRTKKQIS